MEAEWNPDNIIDENDQFLVVYKPAGLAVQSKKISQTDLEHILLNYLAEQGGENGRRGPYLSVIHRLDQPVEGILVFAKTEQAAAVLSRQIRERRMVKEYLAVTDGIPEKKNGSLQDWLAKDGRMNTSKVVRPGTPGAKKGLLEYQCVAELPEKRALLKIRLETGRHHQIRVQLAHAGWPLMGDGKYHPGADSRGQLALCAFRLTFYHPQTGKAVCYQIEPRGEWFRRVQKFF